jgi:Asp/Glu/hydantoin racemase
MNEAIPNRPPARISWEVGLSATTGGRMDDPQPLWDCLERFGRTLVGDVAQVDVHLLPRSTETLTNQHLKLMNDVRIVESVVQRAAEGYDAVMIAPAIDPALFEARSATSVPVVGSLESALVMSQFVGTRVGIVAVHPAYAGVIHDDVRRYGLSGRLIETRPVRCMGLSYDSIGAALDGDGTVLAGEISDVAEALVADGADVIIGACQFFGAALWLGGVTQWLPGGVPYVDCSGSGLLMASGLVSARRTLGLEKSEAPESLFRGASPEQVEEAARSVGIVAAAIAS